MHYAGVLSPDAPDPLDELRERVRRLGFPVMGLSQQASLEDWDAVGFSDMRDQHGLGEVTVSISYTLWRNPADRSDPHNLAVLDERTRDAIETEPPWPRPDWLVQQVQRMRYPRLWEAVRTTWSRDVSELATVRHRLVEHTNHILANGFREELGLEQGSWTDTSWQASVSAVNPAASLSVDGVRLPAVELDTDPFVYGIGAQLRPDLCVTSVIPRAELSYVELALTTRTLPRA